jgi:DNA polymerase-3 subunit gamma/tau
MPYEPLHHKYRPQRFAELVGQEAIATTLTHALEQQRIAPAYLFTGPRGTGKTSSARILAKSLNCLSSDVPTGDPCGVCEVCRMIALGSSLDVIEIDAASNTGVDNIRELIERAQFAPVQCRYKVYVIDECHMLSTAAFNALLKTLEEPPDRVVFILATTDPQRVLPTIISRCQRFDFRRIPLQDMIRHLQAIAQQEKISIHEEALYLVAQLSQGGLRDAQSLLDQLSLWQGEITLDRVWDLVGAVPERDLLNLLRAIAQNNAIAVLDHLRAMLNRGREPLIVLQNLAGMYRDLLIAKTAPDRQDLVALTQETWIALQEVAQGFDLSKILQGQALLRSAEVQLKNTTQPRLWLEVTILGLLPAAIAPAPVASNAAIPIQSLPTVPPAPASVPTQPIPSAPTSIQSNASSVPPANPTLATAPQAEPSPVPPPEAKPAAAVQPIPDRSESFPSLQPSPEEIESPPISAASSPVSATPPHRPPATPESVQAELTEARFHRIWQEVVEHLHPLSKALLRDHGRLHQLGDRTAEVALSSAPLMKIAQSKLADIERAFQEVLGTPIKITLTVIAPSEANPVPAPQETLPTPSKPVPKSNRDRPREAITPASPSPQPPTNIGDRPDAPSAEPTPQPSFAPGESAGEFTGESTDPTAYSSADMPTWQGEDEVTKAAKSLAQMFNGQIVSGEEDLDNALPDDISAATILEDRADLEPEADDEEDLPF